jgi:hypothetical protein
MHLKQTNQTLPASNETGITVCDPHGGQCCASTLTRRSGPDMMTLLTSPAFLAVDLR